MRYTEPKQLTLPFFVFESKITRAPFLFLFPCKKKAPAIKLTPPKKSNKKKTTKTAWRKEQISSDLCLGVHLSTSESCERCCCEISTNGVAGWSRSDQNLWWTKGSSWGGEMGTPPKFNSEFTPEKWMVGRWSFPFGMVYFQGRTVKLPGSIQKWWCGGVVIREDIPDKVQHGFGRRFLYQQLVGWVHVVSWAKNCSCASDICFNGKSRRLKIKQNMLDFVARLL